MKRFPLIIALFISFILLDACKSVPLTGRKQLAFIPSSELNTLSFTSYEAVKDSSRVITGTADARMVDRCGRRIQASVEKYFADKNQSDLLKGFEWEFILIDENIVNAWCMPGGKVAFYTGILPYTKTENGLAVVMGHEIAHAIAQHGNERMSQALVTQIGAVTLSVALSEKREETQALFMGAYGIGAQLGAMLPFSRRHESEADELGLYFMAMAGYDPREAPLFWERMRSAGGGAEPPEFLSTHPAHQTRIDNLNKLMPKALEYYEK